jgi:hypothetical protein
MSAFDRPVPVAYAYGLPHFVYATHPLRDPVRDEVLCVPCFDTEGEWVSGMRFAATFHSWRGNER